MSNVEFPKLDPAKRAAYYELLIFLRGQRVADPDVDLAEIVERMVGHIEDSIESEFAPMIAEFNPPSKDNPKDNRMKDYSETWRKTNDEGKEAGK